MSQMNKECEMCGAESTNVCYKCLLYTCDSCFKIIHNKPPKNQQIKEKIDLYIPIDTKCPLHPTSPNNLFCIDDRGKIIF